MTASTGAVVTRSLRAGIVGMCGWAGARHLAAYRELGVPVTHFVDVAPDAMASAQRAGIAHLASVEALSSAPVDIVSVALPPALQPAVCGTLLAAGKAVLCEKPMAATALDAARVSAVAGGASLMPAFLLRFHPVYRRMKSLIDSGEHGRLREVAIDSRALKKDVGGWRRDVSSGGALLVNGIHGIDLLHWFGGPELAVAAAQAENRHFVAPVSDCVRAWLTTPDGVHLSLRAQWSPFEESDTDSENQEGWTMRVRVELDGALLIQTFNGLRILERGGKGRFEQLKTPNLFAEEIRHFIAVVESGTSPCVTADDNARAQATVERILQVAERSKAAPETNG